MSYNKINYNYLKFKKHGRFIKMKYITNPLFNQIFLPLEFFLNTFMKAQT